jgi:hypothetical protein
VKRALLSAAIVGSIFAASAVRADTEACARAYEEAQILRRDAKLIDARRAIIACAQDSCPSVLRKECAGWLTEVEEAIPTLSVTVHGADGCDRVDARVWIDGVETPRAANGLPVQVDPGSHALRASVDDRTTTQNVVVSAGDHTRVVTLTFAAADAVCGARAPLASTALAPSVLTTPLPASERPLHHPAPGTLVVAGIGLASAIVGSVFAVSAWNQKSTLDDCKGLCAERDVDAMRRTFLVADITGGVAILALGAAAALYLEGR